MAAALSAAIFAIYQIYIPAMAQLEARARDNARLSLRMGAFINARKIRHVVVFIMFVVLFPFIIPAILSESFRVSFVNNFVNGICHED